MTRAQLKNPFTGSAQKDLDWLTCIVLSCIASNTDLYCIGLYCCIASNTDLYCIVFLYCEQHWLHSTKWNEKLIWKECERHFDKIKFPKRVMRPERPLRGWQMRPRRPFMSIRPLWGWQTTSWDLYGLFGISVKSNNYEFLINVAVTFIGLFQVAK